MESLTFKIDEFEGPLDLLLYLISKNKMNLYDIAILELIDQYTALISTLQTGKMDVASEFIEMAARLVQMKSYMLLPRSDEGERMKEELTGQLIEYSACKEIAGKMGEMAAQVHMAVRSPMEIEVDTTYRLHHEVSELEAAWNALMGRSAMKKPPSPVPFEPLVSAPFVSVASRVVHVLRSLVSGKLQTLQTLFRKQDSRSQTVATFLAVLELIREGRVGIEEDASLHLLKGPIWEQEEIEEWM